MIDRFWERRRRSTEEFVRRVGSMGNVIYLVEVEVGKG